MKLLVLSRTFLPTIGGLEIRVAHLVRAWTSRGIDVIVATRTPGDETREAYAVVRNPSTCRQIELFQWADVVYQANLSLRDLWPFALVRRPWVVSHHSWYTRTDGSITLADRLKRVLTCRADTSIAVSRALAADLGPETIVVPNPYREDLFKLRQDIDRNQNLLFVGRLVSDKGLDVLIDALALLAKQALSPKLTVVGDGPELEPARDQALRLGLDTQVVFAGAETGEKLAHTMNRHLVLVAPSRYREPFGIVALEGIASGCVVVCSEGGGLPEAVGPCGLTFPNGDAAALAGQLERVLRDSSLRATLRAGASTHLARSHGDAVAERYVNIFGAAIDR